MSYTKISPKKFQNLKVLESLLCLIQFGAQSNDINYMFLILDVGSWISCEINLLLILFCAYAYAVSQTAELWSRIIISVNGMDVQTARQMKSDEYQVTFSCPATSI